MANLLRTSGVFNLGGGGADGAVDDNWGDVVLLMKGDNNLSDETGRHTPTATSAAFSTDTPYASSSTHSMSFNGTSSGEITLPYSTDFQFGADPFTVEMWFKWDGTTGVNSLFNTYTGSGFGGIALSVYDGAMAVWVTTNGSSWAIDNQSGGFSPTANTWHHVALTRQSNDDFELFFDGVKGTTLGNLSGSVWDSSQPAHVGSNGGVFYYNGLIDDVRITKGIARYSDTFTLPIEAFPTSDVATRPTRRWGGMTGRSITNNSTAPLENTGILTLAEILQVAYSETVYTFEMWGSGGGGGGARTDALDQSGPGGAGAFVGGTLQGLTPGTVLELLCGNIGLGGNSGGTQQPDAGSGAGTSAIRIQGGAIVAAAGGGGGGGSVANSASGDASGGRGGNSVDGSTVYATDAAGANSGIGGTSGTSSTTGSHQSISGCNPPTKTDDLQDGGLGARGQSTVFGDSGGTPTAHPAGWGGTGGRAGGMVNLEGGGGGGGGGYFAGSGGGGGVTGNAPGAGGGGGGSYVNSTYVASYSSAEGSFESSNTHSATAPNQSAGSSATAYTTSIGKGGDGSDGSVDGVDGQPGGVYIYKDGTLVASIATSASETTYTIP